MCVYSPRFLRKMPPFAAAIRRPNAVSLLEPADVASTMKITALFTYIYDQSSFYSIDLLNQPQIHLLRYAMC